ncbi:DNA alkylation repair protein [Rhizobium skierniewicense]|uniref:DNA alkylation repair protein n=1 Tax=Rhizobium skierniewicense TaxID=984260 RepID=UPI001573F416|nr:DNA alkylation repair protein [Rhizobium skierniewicense]NTF33006.1 DNA alkylation repair protein [Rhizobium skierniewicense]
MAAANDTAAPALKEIFNRERLRSIASETKAVYPAFDEEAFLALAEANLDTLGIMKRMRQVATSLHATLRGDYVRNLEILASLAPRINHGFASISLSEYVALYGLEHFDASMTALKFFTRFGSSEFAIRHFILADMPRALATMEEWSRDENEHVRRLASEGCRPRLPWSFQIKALIEDPSPVATILENLKSDDALYVRKSVANHLNDITKDNPQWVLERISTWPKDNKHTAWIIRQALRTLVKKGDVSALAHLGAHEKAEIAIEAFQVTPDALPLGGAVRISASLCSKSGQPQKLVIDYAVHYVKKGGGTSPKIFKWKELSLQPEECCTLSISRAIRDFTTRKHYPGLHLIQLIVNGEALAETTFELSA